MPAPASPGIAARAARIVEEFQALGDWIDRYRYLVELGERMPRLGEAERTDEHRLPGCQYALWLVCAYDPAAGVLRIRADSDARITRGLAALLVSVLDGQPPAVVANAEMQFLDAMGLRTHLSAQRGAGLAALIDELRRRARQCGERQEEPS
jgi:cysteine desulfuration protein SufE